MEFRQLSGTHFHIQYDDIAHILILKHHRILTPDSVERLYRYTRHMVAIVGFEQLCGVILDASQVEYFNRGTVAALYHAGYRASIRCNLTRLPIAYVARTPIQQRILSLAMMNIPGQHRQRLVRTQQQARLFIHGWRADVLYSA